MKKYLSIVLAAIAVGLTACNGVGSPSESSLDTSSASSGISGGSSGNNISANRVNSSDINVITTISCESENSAGNATTSLIGFTEEEFRQKRMELYNEDIGGFYVDITPETNWIIDDFSCHNAAPIAPDGSMLDLSEATQASGNDEIIYSLGFDFAYIRYAKPIYHTTIEERNYSYDYDSFRANLQFADKSDYFKVQAGDILENGLEIKSANYWQNKYGGWHAADVELSGELTLNGVLVLNKESPWVSGKSVIFIPNPCNTRVPTIDNEIGGYFEDGEKFAAIYDGGAINLDYESNFPNGFLNIFKDSRYVVATVTLKDLRFKYIDTIGYRSWAELVSVKVI